MYARLTRRWILWISSAETINHISDIGGRETGAGNRIVGELVILKCFPAGVESNDGEPSPCKEVAVIGEDGV